MRIDLVNAPAMAFVDGEIIRGVAELLFAVVRDLVYTAIELAPEYAAELDTSAGITDAVFRLLRNARVLQPSEPNLVVCWGGHSIGRDEYQYTKEVGYELGLRGLDICTGCGPGAMKGPMKGATIAHAKQRNRRTRYIGITEPGIIAAESPNPIVNHLVIMPDIEKRLEAFVRLGHGIIVFPGGVGTAEEILYLLGILLREENAQLPFPLILTGPVASAPYFEQIDQFIRLTLGDAATGRYEIIVGDPDKVARRMAAGIRKVREYRIAQKDSFYFNWSLMIPLEFQQPFAPTHEAMAALDLHHGRKPHELAADLRRAFSGIVAGNVKEDGMRRIEAVRPVPDPRRPGHDAVAGRTAARVRRAAADEDRRRVPALLPGGGVRITSTGSRALRDVARARLGARVARLRLPEAWVMSKTATASVATNSWPSRPGI